MSLSAVSTAKPSATWSRADSPHFRLYYQASQPNTASLLRWFEQLRSAFVGLNPDIAARPATRIFAFKDKATYSRYSLGAAVDAFYIGTESHDYIAMYGLGQDEFRVAAHEYAHLVMRGTGPNCPLWLSEGLAELLSTVRIDGSSIDIGGAIPTHLQTLKRDSWLSLQDIFAATHDRLRSDREFGRRFYAESWALVSMLLFSPAYASHAAAFVSALSGPASSELAFTRSSGKPLPEIERDLRSWINRPPAAIPLPPSKFTDAAIGYANLSELERRTALADLLLASGDLVQAKEAYSSLARAFPAAASLHEALGEIAWREKNYSHAREQWQRAIDLGLDDADLCFHLASLSEVTAMPSDVVKIALQRAVKLRPDFDDARYRLALMESNFGDFASAVKDLKAMHVIKPSRSFDYWAELSYAANEAGLHDEAIAAAGKAKAVATDADERARAGELAYVASTELSVHFISDANGHTRLATTRIPRGLPPPNPFIQPGDTIRTITGVLTSVHCADGQASAFVVSDGRRDVVLAVERPDRIQVENGPPEFSCGDQATMRNVTAEYASSPEPNGGKVRGLYFH